MAQEPELSDVHRTAVGVAAIRAVQRRRGEVAQRMEREPILGERPAPRSAGRHAAA